MRLLTLLRPRADRSLCCSLTLLERQVWSHEVDGSAFFVRCAGGTVWLTDGEGADRVLHAGDRWGTTRGGTIVVEALSDARLELRLSPRARREDPAA